VRALEGNAGALSRLREMGVGISIDDFGTGYSSLSYLKRLPADALKIDRSFVAGLGEDAEDTAIVGMVVELAHTLGMEVVARGGGDGGAGGAPESMGCDLGQGYRFSRPLPSRRCRLCLRGSAGPGTRFPARSMERRRPRRRRARPLPQASGRRCLPRLSAFELIHPALLAVLRASLWA
jgi:predicted signal transduction protein with EAL and GGDEF domain